MGKVSSKLQVTVPKAIADQYRIKPGSPASRMHLFDEATRRQQARNKAATATGDRGWTRDDLYDRGRPR